MEDVTPIFLKPTTVRPAKKRTLYNTELQKARSLSKYSVRDVSRLADPETSIITPAMQSTNERVTGEGSSYVNIGLFRTEHDSSKSKTRYGKKKVIAVWDEGIGKVYTRIKNRKTKKPFLTVSKILEV